MLDREACERRVYRLALLLLDDPARATRVIEAVVGSPRDLRDLDSVRLDRLTILRCRELASADPGGRDGVVGEPTPVQAVAAALARVPGQSREAWVLTRVYRLTPREAARSMDCSITATERHLQLAETTLREILGGQTSAAGNALLERSMTLDVPGVFRIRQRRRRRLRLLVVVTIVVGVLAALIAVAERWPALTTAATGEADVADKEPGP